MATVTIKITSNNNCIGQFILYDEGLTELTKESNKRAASWELENGKLYYVHLTVVGDDGDKYKIEVQGASEAVYPTSEITLTDRRDDFWIKIIA